MWGSSTWLLLALASAEQAPDFAREVRPILASHCFKCHGQDEGSRKANLRLDLAAVATQPAKSGAIAIVPHALDESELIKRIDSTDADEIMPPPSVKHPLSDAQREILRRWIASGAVYQDHWAFVAPKQAALPAVKNTAWPKGPLDQFILARLESEGLQPSPEADRATLVRRLSLDLIGLPPTIEEADAFINDASPDAYEKLVDRLLASPHYGERWARRWLDLARYADTNGYEKDRERIMWPWRDWVIRALNADMPFNEFTIAQLAGDLLPGATNEQRLATGFHRNTMLNEEGGIDPLEFRFHAMTDRVATTGTTWMGLTTGCAQCHTHKYDPIQHREYYQLMAFLNNADEPNPYLGKTETPEQKAQRAAEATQLLASLATHWPLPTVDAWLPIRPLKVETASGEQPKFLPDDSALFAAPGPEKETMIFTLESHTPSDPSLRLEAMSDPSLPAQGPGRVAHGNFVLSEIRISAAPLDGSSPAQAVKISNAEAASNQPSYPIANAFDGREDTGWAVQEPGKPLNETKTAVFHFQHPVSFPSGTRYVITLAQLHGSNHTMGRVRLSVPRSPKATVAKLSETEQRQRALDQAYTAWLVEASKKAASWTTPHPATMTSNSPLLTWQTDGSILASGDFTKEDHYEIRYDDVPAGVTALRIEALPDARLPDFGPGTAFYEGPRGDYFIGDLTLTSHEQALMISKTSATAGNAALMIDENLQSGWNGSSPSHQRDAAVLMLAQPWTGGPLVIKFQSGRHYSASLGKFRLSFTTKSGGAEALPLEPSVEEILVKATADRTPLEKQQLLQAFLMAAQELAAETKHLRDFQQPPRGQEALVMQERPVDNPRLTHLHHRGEYLQPEEVVQPGVPAFLPSLPTGAAANRLSFAQWLVSREHPLTARVAVNRQWAAIFGTGIVRTLGDFGFQGELPSHPELLDWLAVHFMEEGWSLKKLHRLLVMSATYRQQSNTTRLLRERDPQNRLLARGPRFRVEAELVRDLSLQASGLLSAKMFGPPVRPPQPASVTETAYGGGGWEVSAGEDRYRRALYTFAKRSAPYAAANAFDAPSGEACVARRDLSNTPLQSLTLLNDEVFVETAQALARQVFTQPDNDDARLTHLFRRCLTRAPHEAERGQLLALLQDTRQRLTSGELAAADIAPTGDGPPNERAAWTVLARALLNLDETISKN